MKKINYLLATILLIFGIINVSFAESVPQYNDYATAVLCNKFKPVKLNLNGNKQAIAFRSRLQAAAKQEPNFAGHYILTSWGCGTFCQQLAIIDAETGKVYMPQINNPKWDNYLLGWSYETPHVDSKLLVINAQLTTVPRSNPDALKGKFRNVKGYYKWEDNQLTLLQ